MALQRATVAKGIATVHRTQKRVRVGEPLGFTKDQLPVYPVLSHAFPSDIEDVTPSDLISCWVMTEGDTR